MHTSSPLCVEVDQIEESTERPRQPGTPAPLAPGERELLEGFVEEGFAGHR